MTKTVGIAFADSMEYLPFEKYAENKNFVSSVRRGNKSIEFTLSENGRNLKIIGVECGIGKVNAASCVSFLISDDKADYILNAGLSGAVTGLKKEDFVAGESYVECDFDLTPLGFKVGEKPGQDFVYEADKTLLHLVTQSKGIKTGKLGTGDFFLADEDKKKFYLDTFGICAFDMETAAIASVCHKAGIPMLSLRKISDDAGDAASESYREMNDRAEDSLTMVLDSLFSRMLKHDEIWK